MCMYICTYVHMHAHTVPPLRHTHAHCLCTYVRTYLPTKHLIATSNPTLLPLLSINRCLPSLYVDPGDPGRAWLWSAGVHHGHQ